MTLALNSGGAVLNLHYYFEKENHIKSNQAVQVIKKCGKTGKRILLVTNFNIIDLKFSSNNFHRK